MTSNLRSLRAFIASESGLPALIGATDDDDDSDDDDHSDSDNVPPLRMPLQHVSFGESVAFIVGTLFLVGRIACAVGVSR